MVGEQNTGLPPVFSCFFVSLPLDVGCSLDRMTAGFFFPLHFIVVPWIATRYLDKLHNLTKPLVSPFISTEFQRLRDTVFSPLQIVQVRPRGILTHTLQAFSVLAKANMRITKTKLVCLPAFFLNIESWSELISRGVMDTVCGKDLQRVSQLKFTGEMQLFVQEVRFLCIRKLLVLVLWVLFFTVVVALVCSCFETRSQSVVPAFLKLGSNPPASTSHVAGFQAWATAFTAQRCVPLVLALERQIEPHEFKASLFCIVNSQAIWDKIEKPCLYKGEMFL